MTNQEILRTALQQSSWDCGCRPDDFLSSENKSVLRGENRRTRADLPLPVPGLLVSYGSNIVASINPELKETIEWYISKYPDVHCFEPPHTAALQEKLEGLSYKVCFASEYFLPDIRLVTEYSCRYEIRLLTPEEFESCYTEEWSNALCKKRKHLDMLAAGAFLDGRLIGLAGCSADCENMYQIGVDVLPAYRRQGVAAAVTSRLASSIFRLGKVPFYCAVWSNLPSVRNALKCGFRPAWTELVIKEGEFVDDLNR